MKKYAINSPQVISEVASGETVIINLETGCYYNLGEDASKLWLPLIEGADLNEIKAKISANRPCSIDEIANKADIFFAKLLEEGLIKEVENIPASPLENITVDIEKLVLEIYTDMQDLLGLDPIHEVDSKIGWPVQG